MIFIYIPSFAYLYSFFLEFVKPMSMYCVIPLPVLLVPIFDFVIYKLYKADMKLGHLNVFVLSLTHSLSPVLHGLLYFDFLFS